MPRVRARLVKGVENTASRPSHFRVVGAHLDLDLFDGLDAGNDDRPVSQVGDGDAVDGVVVGASGPAADGEVGGGVLVLHAIELGNAARNDIGSSDPEVEGISGRGGQSLELDAIQGRSARRVRGFQHRGCGVHDNGLGNTADLQQNVHHEEALDSHLDAGPLVGLESLNFDRNGIGPRLKTGKRILTCVVGDGAPARQRGFAPNHDGRAGNDAIDVFDLAPNAAVVGLSSQGARGVQDEGESEGMTKGISHALPLFALPPGLRLDSIGSRSCLSFSVIVS